MAYRLDTNQLLKEFSALESIYSGTDPEPEDDYVSELTQFEQTLKQTGTPEPLPEDRGFFKGSIIDQLVAGTYELIGGEIARHGLERASGETPDALIKWGTPGSDKETYDTSREGVQAVLDKAEEFRQKGEEIPYSPEVLDFLDQNRGVPIWEAFKKAPAKIIAEISARSGAGMALGLSAGAVLGSVAGPAGFATGMGAGSARVEYTSYLINALQEAGIDITDADAIMAAVKDKELMNDIQTKATKRAAVVGGVDAIAGLVGARAWTPALKSAVARNLTAVAAQTPIQGALGGAGEALGSLAIGEEINPRDVAAEVVGEFATAPIDVTVGMRTGIRDDIQRRADANAPPDPMTSLLQEEPVDPLQDFDQQADAARQRFGELTLQELNTRGDEAAEYVRSQGGDMLSQQVARAHAMINPSQDMAIQREELDNLLNRQRTELEQFAQIQEREQQVQEALAQQEQQRTKQRDKDYLAAEAQTQTQEFEQRQATEEYIDKYGKVGPKPVSPMAAALAQAGVVAPRQPDEAEPQVGEKTTEGETVKGHVEVAGMPATLEDRPQGDYGSIEDTQGADGDKLDFIPGPDPKGKIFVIDHLNENGEFEQHKIMAGFPTALAARREHSKQYPNNAVGGITEMSPDEFTAWAQSNPTEPVSFTPPQGELQLSEQQEFREPQTTIPTVVEEKPGLPRKELRAAAAKEADTAETGIRYRLSEPHQQGKQLTQQQAQEVSDQTLSEFKALDYQVHESPDSAPEAIRLQMEAQNRTDAPAVYDPSTGQVHLFANNMTDPDQVVKAALHEAVGHAGLRALVGSRRKVRTDPTGRKMRGELNRLLDDVFAGLSEEQIGTIKDRYGLDPNKTEAQREIADEYIASLAETDSNPPLLQRVIDWVRKALRSVGAVRQWTDNDIRELLRQNRRALRQATPELKGLRAKQARRKAQVTTPEMREPAQVLYQLREEQPDSPLTAAATAETMIEKALADRTPVKKLADNVKDSSVKVIRATLASVPRRHIADFVDKTAMPTVSKMIRTANKMSGRRNELLTDASEVAQGWYKWTTKNKTKARQLAGLMQATTLAQMDISKDYAPLKDPAKMTAEEKAEDQRRRQTYQRLRRNWDYLGAEGQEIYRRVRDVHETQRKLLIQELNKRIDEATSTDAKYLTQQLAAWASNNKTMAQHLDKLLNAKTLTEMDISKNYAPLKNPAKMTAEEKVKDQQRHKTYRRLRRDWDSLDAEGQEIYKRMRALANAKKLTRDLIRKKFESGRIRGVYFPLMRFGDYIGVVKDANGEVVAFSRFERESEATAWKQAWQQENANYAVDTWLGTQLHAETVQQVDPRFAEQVMKAIPDANLQDQIWQLYLRSLPEMSMRKANIHRKGTLGFAADQLRAFSFNTYHSAHQLARLEFQHQLDADMRQIEKEGLALAKNTAHKDHRWATPIVDEMRKRHELAMSPRGATLATAATSLGFGWYLGATPAAAFVNLTQTAIVAYPNMVAKFGVGPATKELIKALGQVAKTSVLGSKVGDARTRDFSKLLTGDELKAWKRAYKDGLFDKTQAHDLAGITEQGIEYSQRTQQVLRVAAYMFHGIEQYNREVTFLAAYRLAVEKGATHNEAFEQAEDLTWDSHFDYSIDNRPRVMQGDWARVLLLFKQYSLNMTYRMARDFKDSIKSENATTRKEARKRFFGMMGMTTVLGGISGLPTYSIVMSVLNNVFGDEDEPIDVEGEMRNAVAEQWGADVAQLIFKGAFDTATGMTLSDRVSLSQLWFRDSDRVMSGSEKYLYLLSQAAGPLGGIVEQGFRAVDDFSNDRAARGFERIMPKAVRDLFFKTYRFATEGATSYRGDILIPKDDFSLLELGGQAIGFAPADLTLQYEQNKILTRLEDEILGRRKQLLNNLFLAARVGDRQKQRKVLAEIREFNKKTRKPISGKTIISSAKSRRRYTARGINGVSLDPDLRYLHSQYDFVTQDKD